MTFKCLVCGKTTNATHLGMDTCRACTVFYRRNHELREILPCAKGNHTCLTTKGYIRACRKCRLDRFEAVIRAGSGEAKALDPVEVHGIKRSYIIPPPVTGNLLLERIRSNYKKLSTFRRTEELRLRGIFPNAVKDNDLKSDLIPSTYQQMNEGKKIQIDALFKFIPATFPAFGVLLHSEKWMLIRNFHRCFHCLDSVLRSRQIFGKEAHNYFFASYTTYVSLSSIDHFFSDSPDRRQAAAATEFLLKSFQRIVGVTSAQLHLVDPSEDELLALIGLAFWSLECVDPSDELMNLAENYRTEITAELAAHYRGTIGEEKGAIRIGLLLCMLQEIKRAAMTLQSDYELYRMLGTFDDNTLTYRLRVCE